MSVVRYKWEVLLLLPTYVINYFNWPLWGFCISVIHTPPSVAGTFQNYGVFGTCRVLSVAYSGILFGGGGGSTNSVEDRGNGDLGAVPPSQEFWRQL